MPQLTIIFCIILVSIAAGAALRNAKWGEGHIAYSLPQSRQQAHKEIASVVMTSSKQNNTSINGNLNRSSTISVVHQVAKKCLDVMFDELNNGDTPVATTFLERLNTILTEIAQDPGAFTPYHPQDIQKKRFSSALTNPRMCDWHDPETGKSY